MTATEQDCMLCRGRAGDPELERIQVWEDDYPLLAESEQRQAAQRVQERLAAYRST